MSNESLRLTQLWEAEKKAVQLFEEIENRQLIAEGRLESEINKSIYNLALEMFGVKKHWHKRIVRAGANTLLPYRENPPDLRVRENDIVFLDFGPVFEEWEADFGRTYVLGNDTDMLWIKDDCEKVWKLVKAYYDTHPQVLASELFNYSVEIAKKTGWEFGGPIAGHLIGEFPHEKIYGEETKFYIHPENNRPMNAVAENGKQLYWILETHLVDREKQIGAFFEQMINCE